MQGEIRGRHPVRLDGGFDGTVQIEGVLHIGPTAVVTGEFTATHIIVEGNVDGSLTAPGRVEFRATAKVRGDTQARRVAVEEGAIVNGQIAMTEEPAPTRSPGAKTQAAVSTSPLRPAPGQVLPIGATVLRQ